MSFTVIIPAFNEERCLRSTVQSVKRAAALVPHHALTVVVVDDQSTDRTAAVASLLGVEVRTGERRGIGAARNLGAAYAAQGTLVFVDADTTMDENALQAISVQVSNGARFGAVAPVYDSSAVLIRVLLKLWRWYAPRRNMTQGVCQFFLAEDFHALGGYDESVMMAEDTELNSRCINAFGIDAMVVIDEARVHPSMRRYETWGSIRSWVWTNPITTKLFRRSRRFWKGWYDDPPR